MRCVPSLGIDGKNKTLQIFYKLQGHPTKKFTK